MNSPAPLGTTLLPAATLVAAAFLLAGALSSASLPTPTPAPAHPALLEAAPVEIEACERAGARSHVDCVGEAEGKALIRHAEWVAALEETSRDGGNDVSSPTGPVIVVRPQRAVSQ